MGRGGRAGGGMRGGGGSFGGSRSGGGRIGGGFNSGRGGSSSGSGFSSGRSAFGSGRSGNSYGGNSFGSGFLGGYLGSRIGNRNSAGVPDRRNSGGGGSGGGSSGCGCSTVLAVIVIILLILGALYVFSPGSDSMGSIGGSSITKSTVAREPLVKGSVNETEYYTDEVGWIQNKTKLLEGLKYFYRETGVQPYVFITDTVNGSNYPSYVELEDFANDLYDELFTDEAHLLLVFFEYTPTKYMDYYVAGTQAKTIIDTEAGDILLDYIDKYYYSDMSEDEFFSKSFADAADRIMEVTKSPWIPVLVVLGVIVIIIIIFTWWKHIKKQKNLEAKQTEDILNSPIEKFSDSEAEDLTKKYDDTNND